MASQHERQENLLQDCVNSLKTWKELIETHLEGAEQATELSELETVVKDYCLVSFNASKSSEACREVLDYFHEESNNHDVDELYNTRLGSKTQTFGGNYQQEGIWKEVYMGVTDRDVEEVERTSQEDATEYEEMGDSIFYSNVFTPPVDPISKMVIQEPYKSRKCGHVYDYKFILQYIKDVKNRAKCPYIGCSNGKITVEELVKDNETKSKIENYQRNTNTESD
ncbi:E3 SUMO-protein ligase NSE2-like [Tribolium madens]|uniref:E3 SUMO-protein ligase NSE2-like n=1 Tax=Tribolium madens TaxID=41895 RepID=UPI001CF746D5|nr:E3 SUMO-protein ligase NSE2-like [Tribolium madens]